MSKKCDICKKAPATVHLTNINNNVKTEMHMCESCAEKNGVHIHKTFSFEKVFTQKVNPSLNSIDFVLNTDSNANEENKAKPDITCDKCGMKWKEFRKSGRLGCANDYEVFKKGLLPLFDEIHASTVHHVGKSPSQNNEESQYVLLVELKRKLRDAVAREDYELAAKLRDQIENVSKDF